jgi:hypothetical protein
VAETRFPLSWPDGWPRTHGRESSSRFNSSRNSPLTFSKARTGLLKELNGLGAEDVILSSNHRVNRDGQVIETANVKDHGVAVYFELKGKKMVMAQDVYANAAGNMRSLALAIEGMRQMRRHGGAHMMERAFAGFAALPDPNNVDWRAILGFKRGDPIDADAVQKRFRNLAMNNHPDTGGDADYMTKLNVARDQALAELQ